MTNLSERQKIELRATVGLHFRPGAPIDSFDLFAGRKTQVRKVVDAVTQPGRHAMIFGERGVGKTSLAKVIAELLGQGGQHFLNSGTINCDGTDNFTTLWRKVFRELEVEMQRNVAGIVRDTTPETVRLDELLPKTIKPDDIRYFLTGRDKPVVIVLDEVDRITDSETATLLADTIKNLSDHASPVTLILVGVADAVDGLVKEHKSIERALEQIQMPRMSRDELIQIIDKGLSAATMTIDDAAKGTIAMLSRGLPHYTHLLSLHSAKYAIDNDRLHITMYDVMAVMDEALKNSQSVLSAYHKATVSPQKGNLYEQVLLACALADCDDLGYFSAAAVKDPLSIIMGKTYDIPSFTRHLNDFSGESRGTVLNKSGEPRRFRFRFNNPLMQPFVVLHGMAKHMLTADMISLIKT